MSKPTTEALLSEQLTADRTWRIREISDLKSAIGKADSVSRRVLLRALVAVGYAHWEGYVRFAARKYLEHIALRKFKYSELDAQFLKNYFLPRLSALSSTKSNVSERCNLVAEILGSSDKTFSSVNEDLVSTKSNLNHAVFSDICLICGVDASLVSHKETFIDVVLLKRRNAIAHGEDTFIAISDMDQIADETVALMRFFGDQLENRVVLKAYRAAS